MLLLHVFKKIETFILSLSLILWVTVLYLKRPKQYPKSMNYDLLLKDIVSTLPAFVAS